MVALAAVLIAALCAVSVAYAIATYATRKSHAPRYPAALGKVWWE